MKGEVEEEVPAAGTRIGRYVLLRDVDGHLHAIAATALIVASDAEDGETVIQLPAARSLRLPVPLATVLMWFTGNG
jgi:hypothetical protein